ncbi:SDR family oxidoreductase [Candidatus Albibeggiatoa sp. nov. NOAA]|uniref:SDR family NAD(P)-dependent oxidoreductase n=1 Tax=Candidatus Albibeggiatoa sp. nov. NOAA TaxID=3162724 RepID=UPI003302248F|nr:SDR family oxidoreductase [Thiotrichaceae bacterium]
MMDRQVLFITGGAKGIGKATVEHALSQGWDVAFTYWQSQKMADDIIVQATENYPQQRCKAYQLDVKDSEAIETVGEQVLEDFDNVDAVINNAGIDKPGNVVMLSDEEWQEVITTNLTASFYVTRFFLPVFLANNYGRFITLSSLAKDGSSGQVAYAASKAGLVGFAKTIAKEYGHKGITSNIVLPGLIETEIIGEDAKGLRTFFNQYNPAKRLGNTTEIAQSILFLCSKEASYINGTVLNITGGIDWVY